MMGAMTLTRMALDIETDTSRNGLVAHLTRVVSVAVYGGPGDQAVFDGSDERRLLDELARVLDAERSCVIETWNGCGFDLPMLAARAAACGSRLQVDLRSQPERGTGGTSGQAPWFGRIGGHAHRDLMIVWQPWASSHLRTCRLKVVARAFGLAPIELEVAKLNTYRQGEVADYNLSDARVTWLLGAISLANPELVATSLRKASPLLHHGLSARNHEGVLYERA